MEARSEDDNDDDDEDDDMLKLAESSEQDIVNCAEGVLALLARFCARSFSTSSRS